ncbi:hypothetical protein DW172_17170 [Agathobacter rectalis]|jgi:hypothetical protein|uniref:Uncharacterized protein n=2 Tax=Agathobacter rectalis TaxID=39491 RepID=A0A3E4XY73_9FIRM|nr:hypothetical protein [Agathobacter rectalis]RGK38219.1 hypothetical protein DXD13_15915 [Agathobacter rectalis]RGM42348.1 hypothetical protein DXC13_16205 [Agathobacter rectalis]RGM64715.1 hypothetical protein DXB99_19480 [Agathobacter rectalis]RHI15321.1 hypothetical protein DW172_17170 [Agathobacter rectalis]
MNYDVLINTAIEKNEVLQLLRGEKEYEVIVSEFSPDIFPTDITSVLVECFYKQIKKIENIEKIFTTGLEKLLLGDAGDVYIAVLYFDACIFQEERNKATFTLDRKIIAEKIRTALNEKKEQLQESVTYKNGMTKKNPWKNIENFNNYYCKKYDFNIIEYEMAKKIDFY